MLTPASLDHGVLIPYPASQHFAVETGLEKGLSRRPATMERLGQTAIVGLLMALTMSGGRAEAQEPNRGLDNASVAGATDGETEISRLRARRQNRKRRAALLLQRQRQAVDHLQRYRQQARLALPRLQASHVQHLAVGELVRLRHRPESASPHQAVGLQWVDLPRQDLWIAAQDAHFGGLDETLEFRLTQPGEKPTLWLGFIDLPWPLKNRRWVVEVWDNLELAALAGLDAWEHGWQLTPDALPRAEQAIRQGLVPGMTEEIFAKAIWTPLNHGAWLMIAMPDGGTLVGFHATFEIGGSVPDRLVVANTLHGLERLFGMVVERARSQVKGHYSGDHQAILGGDGQPIPPYATAQ